MIDQNQIDGREDFNKNKDKKQNFKPIPLNIFKKKTGNLNSLLDTYQNKAKKFLNESLVNSNIDDFTKEKEKKKELNQILTQRELRNKIIKSQMKSLNVSTINVGNNDSLYIKKNKLIFEF